MSITRTSEHHEAEAFCRRVGPGLVDALAAFTGDRDAAQDLAQEALARAWARWGRVGRLDRPDAWCYHVALNLARSRFRREATRQRTLEALASRSATAPTGDVDVTARLEARRALLCLSPRHREVLVLRFVADLSVEDTAVALGCSEGTVKSMTSRAAAALREVLAVEEGAAR